MKPPPVISIPSSNVSREISITGRQILELYDNAVSVKLALLRFSSSTAAFSAEDANFEMDNKPVVLDFSGGWRNGINQYAVNLDIKEESLLKFKLPQNTALVISLYAAAKVNLKPSIVYLLLADEDGTTRSKDYPIGIAVTSEEAARQYVKSGGIGYTHSYIKVRVFETAKEGLAWKKDN